ncbi:MAG: hypothetical protein P1U39_05255 [Legionellaceae bacterium]|nr:hypothetical protein [Legionellaceae bacterium]
MEHQLSKKVDQLCERIRELEQQASTHQINIDLARLNIPQLVKYLLVSSPSETLLHRWLIHNEVNELPFFHGIFKQYYRVRDHEEKAQLSEAINQLFRILQKRTPDEINFYINYKNRMNYSLSHYVDKKERFQVAFVETLVDTTDIVDYIFEHPYLLKATKNILLQKLSKSELLMLCQKKDDHGKTLGHCSLSRENIAAYHQLLDSFSQEQQLEVLSQTNDEGFNVCEVFTSTWPTYQENYIAHFEPSYQQSFFQMAPPIPIRHVYQEGEILKVRDNKIVGSCL